ncbi:MAG: T9SS type A sorting domain-containing protein [Salinivirgaceae bacterium]|nr:T9SS type A sorting domain-containing protein [Salinivirgaceae bacterium]
MKRITVQTSIILIISLCIALLTEVTNAQNFWQQKQQKNTDNLLDPDCPVYNVGNEEVNIQWQMALGETSQENIAHDFILTPDSSYIYLYYSGTENCAIAVYLDKERNEQWRYKCYTPDSISFGNQVLNIGDDIYISGSIERNDTRNFGVLKFNSSGKLLWYKELPVEKSSVKKSILYNPCLVNVENNNLFAYFIKKTSISLAKLDSLFNVVWEIPLKDLGINSYVNYLNIVFDGLDYWSFVQCADTCYYYQINNNGEQFISGKLFGDHTKVIYKENKFYSTGFIYGTSGTWIRRYSSEFDLEMEYVENNDQYLINDPGSLEVLSDKSIIVFHDYYYAADIEGHLGYNMNIRHIDENGNCKGLINLLGSGSTYSNKLIMTNDEDFIIYGHGYNAYYNQQMILLAQIGKFPVSVNHKKAPLKLNITPNPVHNGLQVSFDTEKTGVLCLYSFDGKLIYTRNIYHEMGAALQMSGYSNGIYLVRFTDEFNNQYFSKTVKN